MPEPTEPVVVTEGAPTESPAEAALNHAAPDDASTTQEALNARIDESLGIIPAPKMETPKDPATTGADDNKPAGDGVNDGGDGTSGKPGEGEAVNDKGTGEPAAPKPEEAPKPSDKGPEPTPASSTPLTLEVEDAAGKKYQIASVDDLPEDFQPKNNRQALQILRDLDKLEVKRETLATQEATAKEAAETKANEQARLASWDAEIAALQTDNRLEKPKATPGSTGFLEDPAVKRVDQVFKYMVEENARRATANIAPIRSFTDALDKIELQEVRATQAAAAKQETQTAKAKSGLIGRTSAGGNDSAPIYRAGSARSMDDL